MSSIRRSLLQATVGDRMLTHGYLHTLSPEVQRDVLSFGLPHPLRWRWQRQGTVLSDRESKRRARFGTLEKNAAGMTKGLST